MPPVLRIVSVVIPRSARKNEPTPRKHNNSAKPCTSSPSRTPVIAIFMCVSSRFALLLSRGQF